MADNLHSAWPLGSGGIIMLRSVGVDFLASKTAKIFDQITIPFTFRPVKAEVSSWSVTITNGASITITDTASSVQTMVSAQTVSAATAGAQADPEALTIADVGPYVQGDNLEFKYTTGASDTSISTIVTLWIQPEYKL